NQPISQKPYELQRISSKFEAAIWLAKHPYDIWYKILSQFLEATKQPALHYNKRIWNALGDFVQEAIKKIIILKIEKTDMKVALYSCDAIIVNLPILTILGVVTCLPVQDLLNYQILIDSDSYYYYIIAANKFK
ncbi:16414_t:CDS:2, partial [Racocetra fulgida]